MKAFYEFEVGKKSYRLRIKSRQAAALEKALGCSPLVLFIKLSNIQSEMELLQQMPSIETYALILNAALQAYEHGFDMNKTHDLIDDYIDEGHSFMELLNVVIGVLSVSGYMPDNAEEDAKEE